MFLSEDLQLLQLYGMNNNEEMLQMDIQIKLKSPRKINASFINDKHHSQII